jgi:hypothetical protein
MREDKVSKANYQDSQLLNRNLENWQTQKKVKISNKCQMSYIQIIS